MSFRYPTHPNTGRTDPFVDADGKNPFADPEATAEKVPDNPYSAPAATGPLRCPPNSCQVLYPHRGRTVFRLGLIGFCCACGADLAAAGFLAPSTIASGFLAQLGLLLLILSLSASSTAWMFGRQDSKAIRAGAMDPAGLKRTQQGRRLGVAGTLISIQTLATLAVGTALQ